MFPLCGYGPSRNVTTGFCYTPKAMCFSDFPSLRTLHSFTHPAWGTARRGSCPRYFNVLCPLLNGYRIFCCNKLERCTGVREADSAGIAERKNKLVFSGGGCRFWSFIFSVQTFHPTVESLLFTLQALVLLNWIVFISGNLSCRQRQKALLKMPDEANTIQPSTAAASYKPNEKYYSTKTAASIYHGLPLNETRLNGNYE